MVSKYKEGEYIHLYFDGPDPGWYLIKGWHDAEHCQKKIFSYYGDDAKHVVRVKHKYGLWAISRDEMNDPCHMFLERDEPGRGRFKITLSYVDGIHKEVIA